MVREGFYHGVVVRMKVTMKRRERPADTIPRELMTDEIRDGNGGKGRLQEGGRQTDNDKTAEEI